MVFRRSRSLRGTVAAGGSIAPIDRAAYADKLYGFWLGECTANWTEMDKITDAGVWRIPASVK